MKDTLRKKDPDEVVVMELLLAYLNNLDIKDTILKILELILLFLEVLKTLYWKKSFKI